MYNHRVLAFNHSLFCGVCMCVRVQLTYKTFLGGTVIRRHRNPTVSLTWARPLRLSYRRRFHVFLKVRPHTTATNNNIQPQGIRGCFPSETNYQFHRDTYFYMTKHSGHIETRFCQNRCCTFPGRDS